MSLGVLIDMRISIYRIPQEGMKFSYDYNPKDLDLNSEGIEFKSNLHAQVTCYRISNAVTIEMKLGADREIKCSRCLEVVLQPFDKKINFSKIVSPKDSFIDLTQDLREELILDTLINPLCKPGCLGLCPKCGKNLNEGKCDCKL